MSIKAAKEEVTNALIKKGLTSEEATAVQLKMEAAVNS
jgi:hypothetical protein